MRAIAVLTLVASLLSMPAELVPAASAAQVVVAPRCARAEEPYAAIVDAKFAGADGTMIDGAPTYRTIGAALTGLPVNGGARTVIFIRNGTYREKLTIDRPRVTLRGESRDRTVLTFDAVADTPAPGGGTYGTRGSFTLRIVAPDFRAEDLTIENAFDYAANAAKANDDPSKLKNPQGVALMLDLGSDRASIENCRILGHQDTLFTNAGRSYFHRTLIAGHVDFIFGAGQAVFDDCDIVSLDRGSKSNNGYITAPSTNVDAPYGLVFLHSRLQKEKPTMAARSVVLGRPWHPFADPRAVGSAVFIDCWLDDHIGDRGWERMSSVDSTGTRIWYEPQSARFFEYRSSGPGAAGAGRSPTRRMLSDADAARFTIPNVLGGWTPPGVTAGARTK
jgi:pectinesterase